MLNDTTYCKSPNVSREILMHTYPRTLGGAKWSLFDRRSALESNWTYAVEVIAATSITLKLFSLIVNN